MALENLKLRPHPHAKFHFDTTMSVSVWLTGFGLPLFWEPYSNYNTKLAFYGINYLLN